MTGWWALVLMVLPVGSLAAADSILANGGFDSGRAPWWGEGTWSVEQGALRVAAGYVCQDKRPAEGGRRYRVAARVHCEGAPAGAVFVQASFRGPGLQPGWYGPARVGGEAALMVTGGTHDWRLLEAEIEAPAAADQWLLYLRKAQGSAGTAWFDDVSITPLPAATQVRNGGFEEGRAPWWGDGEWTVAPGQGVDGSAALSVRRGFVCQDKIAVEPRATYRLSLRIRADGAAPGAVYVQCSYRGPGVDAGWRGPAQVRLGERAEPALFVTGGTHGWREYALNLETPAGATQMLIYLRRQDGPGAAWFDQVSLTSTTERPTTAAELRRAELAAELLPEPSPAAAAELAAALGLARGPAREVALARARVHVGAGADVVSLGAAKELADLLARITGGNYLPLSHDGATLGGPLLVVGRDGELARAMAAGVDWASLGEDGFVLRSAGAHLLLAGATPRGTLNAVYWFLDRRLGVRWFSPDFTLVPSAPERTVGPLDETHVPRFAYREVLSHEGQQKVYKAHNLLNGDSHGPSFLPTPPEIDVFERDWQNKGGYANFLELLPPDRYRQAHPEWYAGGQLAMMDEGLRAEMARVVIERLRAHPDYRRIWFNIHDMDWGRDMDPASAAFAQRHGGNASAPRLDMVIDVANRVRGELPGARLAFNAYHWSFTPPTGMTVPDHVLVFPMTIHVDYSTPLNVGRNVQLGRDLAGWASLAKNVQVWDHITNWSGFLQPTPNVYPIGRSIQWLATLPTVRGYFAEGSWDTPGAELAALRVWLIARLLWDPSLDPVALVAEFCSGYYGAGAGPLVAQAIDLLHERAAVSGDVLGEKANVDLKLFDRQTMLRLDDLMARAELAAADDPVRLRHVRAARMPFDYVLLARRAEYGLTDVALRLTRFRETLATEKVRQYRQGGSLAELDALLAVERRPSAPPEGLPDGDKVEIGDLAVNRYDSAWVVADAAASDGGAVRMKGDSASWAVQLKLDKLPRTGEWDVYAAVRVEAEPGHDGEIGVRVGSAPPMGRFTTATVGELSDGRYHWVKAPGGPHRWSADHGQSLYVQAPGSKWLRWVWTDRFVAVRAR